MALSRAADAQLSFDLAALSEAAMVGALRARGCRGVCEVSFRANRSRLISLTAGGTRLNLHECFRSASPEVLDAIAAFAGAKGNTGRYRAAIARLRAWHEGQVAAPEEVEAGPGTCCGTAAQRQLLAQWYRQLNRAYFGGRLPELTPVRLSDRMRRRLGHVQYGGARGDRTVTEIALNVDLLLPGNEHALRDTLLHELAHAEAWLIHGHRGHGRIWRTVAARVGCEARACSAMRIRRRRRGTPVTDRVPELVLR
jgi:hypothetical protein